MTVTFKNPFVLDVDDYKRDVKPIAQYVEIASSYLYTNTGQEFEFCKDFVKSMVGKNGKYPITDRTLAYTERGENGDRELKEGSYLGYIRDSIKEGLIIAPTLTAYKNKDEVQSFHVSYVEGKLAYRGILKKEMYAALALNEKLEKGTVEQAVAEYLANRKNIGQKGTKTKANSLSGAQASLYNAIYNKTAHSTLTSNCRVDSSAASMNNEKLLGGSRHYWGFDVVLNNIASIVARSNYTLMEQVMTNYGLVYPSVDQVMACIKHSTDKYWRNNTVHKVYRDYVEKLKPIERAAFVYTGDLYHLMKLNTGVISTMLTRLAQKDCSTDIDVEHIKSLKQDAMVIMATVIMDKEMAGIEVKKLAKGSDLELRLYSIVANAMVVLMDYSDLIHAFITTQNMPASLAFYPECIRDVALSGDTDSTIYTVQEWVGWLNNGVIGFDQHCNAIAAVMVFLSDQTIVHILAMIVSNIGVHRDHKFMAAMKNEYSFRKYIPTQVSKHYVGTKDVQEGLVFKAPKLEKKGVHMKSATAPVIINDAANDFILLILKDLDSGKVSAEKLFRIVIEQELRIIESLKAGEPTYFRFQQIKNADTYKNPDPYKSNYQHYLFWNKVFGKAYAMTDAPPYVAIKGNLMINNKTQMKQWLDSIENPDIRTGFDYWMQRTGKTEIKTLYMPVDAVINAGMPKEIASVLDVRKTTFDLCKTFYICLESLSLYTTYVNDKKRFILSDLYFIDGSGNVKPNETPPEPIIMTEEEMIEEDRVIVDNLNDLLEPDYERAYPDDCPF